MYTRKSNSVYFDPGATTLWITPILVLILSGCSKGPESTSASSKKSPAADVGPAAGSRESGGISSSAHSDQPTGATSVASGVGVEPVKIDFVVIPGGEFTMGDLRSGRRVKEKVKPHKVSVSSFEMSKYEITVGQFKVFAAATNRVTSLELSGSEVPGFSKEKADFIEAGTFTWKSPGIPQTDQHPVVYVSRTDALAFCKWLSDSTGRVYRLPTEAEWEYACRGDTTTRFSCGDDSTAQAGFANVADKSLTAIWSKNPFEVPINDKFEFTSPVGSFKPNAFGLFDMHGNVWEWCSDRYSPKYYAKSPVVNPTGPQFPASVDQNDPSVAELSYVARGGSFVSFVADSSFRNAWSGTKARLDFGFRVVRQPN